MKWTDISLSALQYFVDSIELESLTAAADKNHVSRPAVSQAIRRLEEITGFELITHSRNRLELTDKGKAFLQKAKRGLALFNEALSEKEISSDRINIACSNTLAEFVVLPALKKLKVSTTQYLRLQIGTTSKVRELISEGKANLGFIIDDEQTHGMKTKFISEGRFVLRSTSARFKEPLFTTEVRPEVAHLTRILAKQSFRLAHHMTLESWSICRKAAESLGGTCLIPDIIPTSSLKPVLDLKYVHKYQIKAVYKTSNFLTKAEIDLIDQMQSLKRPFGVSY